MNGKIRPPSSGFDEVVLYRAAYSDEVEIFIGENSYTMLAEPARMWFKAMCGDDYTLNRVFGYLWNMRSLKYFVATKTFIPFAMESRSVWNLIS